MNAETQRDAEKTQSPPLPAPMGSASGEPYAGAYRIMEQSFREAQRQLAEALEEVRAYREGGVTEEILRRNNGYIKVGRGCVIALASEVVPNVSNSATGDRGASPAKADGKA